MAGLFGAHVFQGADDHAVLGKQGLFRQALVDCLGDAEVNHLGHRLAIGKCHQHIRGLDIAVNDSLLMGVLNRLAHRNQQLEAFLRRETIAITKDRDRDTCDEVHDEVWAARFGGARVEDPGDILMVHECQRLALGLEAGDHLVGIHPWFDDLERDFAAYRTLLHPAIDDAHAPFADFLDKPVASDVRAETSDHPVGWDRAGCALSATIGCNVFRRVRIEASRLILGGTTGPGAVLDPFFDALPQHKVVFTRLIEEGHALGRVGLSQGFGDDRLNSGVGPVSRHRQVSRLRHPRSVVAGHDRR